MLRSPMLQIEEVTKQFSRRTLPAVANVTLALDQGDLLSLLGPSGCGKTTLLRLIAGFERPQFGTITIDGKVVASPHDWTPPERRDVGMVFQDYALFPHLSVGKNVAFGLQHGDRLPRDKMRSLVADALELVGLTGLESRYPHELSGGQQQRVALARAIAPQPKLVLLDEPLSNLDVQLRQRLRQELRDILKAAKQSTIFVTHDREEALAISDQVAVMRDGQIEQIGKPAEVYTQPRSRFVAEFVTQANILPAISANGLIKTEIGDFDLPQALDFEDFEDVEVAIWQEDLHLELAENSGIVIRDRIYLGREFIYCLLTQSGQELLARTTSRIPLPVGATVQVSVPIDAIRLYPKC
jgi:iron(III) transport system ATP-binding protein